MEIELKKIQGHALQRLKAVDETPATTALVEFTWAQKCIVIEGYLCDKGNNK